MAKILDTNGEFSSGTSAELQSYDVIRVSADDPTGAVFVQVSDGGTLDLTKALEGKRGAFVYASDEGNTITGGAKDDVLLGGAAADTLNGGAGNDELQSYGVGSSDTADDVLNGGAGNDTIFDYGGKVAIDGGTGNDRIYLDYGVTGGTVDGGADRDVLSWNGLDDISSLTIKNVEVLETRTASFTGTAAQFTAFSRIVTYDDGSAEASDVSLRLSGSGALNLTKALEGKRGAYVYASDDGNTITGGAKDDHLYGGAGADTLNGGAGNDELQSYIVGSNDTADDVLNGGAGDDRIFDYGGKAAVNGGAGNDRVYLGNAITGGTVDGGADRDVLSWNGLSDISNLTIKNVEVLEAAGGITATAAQLQGFNRIVYYDEGGYDGYDVTLTLKGAGSLDLTKALEGQRAAYVYASDAGNTITGGAIDDDLYGGAKADTLNGGDGNDTLYGQLDTSETANDTLNGGAGDDTITDYGGKAAINGGAGNDHIYLGSGITGGTVDGGADRDVLQWNGVNDISKLTISNVEVLEAAGGITATVKQLQGFDRIVYYDEGGYEGYDVSLTIKDAGTLDLTKALEGQRGAYVYASDAGNTITGGAKDDHLYGGTGSDTLNGGDGNDTLIGSVSSINALTGDTLNGGAGNDLLNGASGNDTLNGGAGDDTIYDYAGKAAIDGGTGNDHIYLGSGITGGMVDGGADRDVLGWNGLSDISNLMIKNVEVLETAGTITATAAQLQGFDRIVYYDEGGYDGYDVTLTLKGAGELDLTKALDGQRGAYVFASDAGNTITGGAKDDYLYGRAGSDTLNGGAGNDTLGSDWSQSETANDVLNGGAGNDTIFDFGGEAAIDGGTGNDQITLGSGITGGMVDGGADRDVLGWNGLSDISNLTISNVEVLEAAGGITATASQLQSFDRIVFYDEGGYDTSPVSLTIKGASSLDLTKALEGQRAAAIYTSDVGNAVTGGAKGDTFFGGTGNDTFKGAGSNDALYGGDGNDTAVYDGNYVNYTLSGKPGDVSFQLQGNGTSAGDGTDLLVNMEFIRFKDGVLDLATGKFTPSTVYDAPKVVLSGAAAGGTGGVALTLDGQAAAGKTVDIYNGAVKLGSVTVDNNGRFSATLSELKLPAGATTAELKITAKVNDGTITGPASESVVVEIGTGAGLAAKLSTYAATAGLAAVFITDGMNLAFGSKAALDTALGDYAAVLAKVVGTYTLSVETTDAAGKHSDLYLADGTLRKSVLVAPDGALKAAGYAADGVTKITEYAVHDGVREEKHFAVTGKAYAREEAVYDAKTNKPVSIDRYDANGKHVFSDVFAADGSHTVTEWKANGDMQVRDYDAKGRLTAEKLTDGDNTLVRTQAISADGSSETHRYDRDSGVETSATLREADGSRVEKLLNVQNKAYVEQDSIYSAGNKLLSIDQMAADGSHAQFAKAAGQVLVSHVGVADVFTALKGGADAFAFDKGFGKDTVSGFQAGGGANHDVLRIDDSYASSFADLTGKITKSGADTLISLAAGDTILLKGIAPNALTSDNFQFIHHDTLV
ncbi:beta strand repeat-containing protein [Aureimonas leprariae]|uniref:Calcium-binding protein n=1 Tax=Plantimonas leprariae TaxID=2615207 RepID=A0A7V7PRG6_9HYPH|nr:calcium-binding protein [Aureimonas leprariae]KAB0681328.1 calcium-binding protein [Aureimonas leprariae]